MAQPQWVTPAGSLGTIAENIFYQIEVEATDSDGETVTYALQAGSLPQGIQVLTNGTIEGVPLPYSRVQGVPTEVAEDVTSNFVIRATVSSGGSTRINDRTFSLTVTGQDAPTFTTTAGSLGTFFDGDQIEIDIEFSDPDPDDTVVVALESGELPPGLSVSTDGKIAGYILPVAPLPDTAIAGFDRAGTEFAEFPFDFTTRSISLTYEFTLSLSDGKEQTQRTFSMYVVSKDSLTADTLDFTGDIMLITSDVLPERTPIITNYPEATTTTAAGFIGTFRDDNFFAYQLQGLDLDGDPFEFTIVTGDSADIPPNLSLNLENGWLTGYFPNAGATETTYEFSVTIEKKGNPTLVSSPYAYSLKVIGNIETAVTWNSGTLIPGTTTYNLGTIANGDLSLFNIDASTDYDSTILFRLKTGGVYNKLPQGLSLLPSGAISGRVSFNGFALDGGTTTFDETRATRLSIDPTTFDNGFVFTVNAYTADGLVNVFRTFKITVTRTYNTPYESLYIEALLNQSDKNIVNSLLLNQDIFDPEILFRPTDPWFGVSRKVRYTHAFGTSAATLESYVEALQLNHFRKRLVLGPLRTAQALDANDNIIYELVYSEIIDTGVNQAGESPGQTVKVTFPFVDPNDGSTLVNFVYPNSLINMRDQVIDTVGRTSTQLPLWMQTKQEDGRVLGFTKAWIIAYTKPGESKKLAYNIQEEFGTQLNKIDFIADRYILDRLLTKNWVPFDDSTESGDWVTQKQTTFNYDQDTNPTVSGNRTTFDEASMRFIHPVDTYEYTDEYNKYLLYPKTNILQ
jgi:hypothetical protein